MMGKKCAKTREIYLRYVNKSMFAGDNEHIAACPACKEFIENTREMIKDVRASLPPIPTDLREKVSSAIKKARAEEADKQSLKERLKKIAYKIVEIHFPSESIFFDKIWSIFEKEPEMTRSTSLPPKRILGAVALVGGDAGKEARLARIVIVSFLRAASELGEEASSEEVAKKVIEIARRCRAPRTLIRLLEGQLNKRTEGLRG
jgi:hypothetical protein